MIGTTAPEYWFIRLCIFGLHWIAPLSILYVVFVISAYGLKAARYPFPLLVEVGAVCETLFFLVVYLPYRRHLQKAAEHPPTPPRAERQALFALCNDNIPDHEAYFQKWFLGSRPEEIKRENVKEFFLWAFFNREGPPGDDDAELEEYITLTEKQLGRDIEKGRGTAQCLRLTIDPTNMLHRSLIWYLCVGFVDFLACIILFRHGFTFYRSSLTRFFTLFPFRFQTLFARNQSPVKHTTYWYRPHTSRTKLPVLFIHGIGIGLYPYTNFLNQLNSEAGLEGSGDADDQVGIIALEIMPVSFRITHPALAMEVMCEEIRRILEHHGWNKVVLVSHSYGTVVSTHLLQDPKTKSMVGPVVLIDPVSILLHLPDVAYNFTRRQPYRANEHQLYYFASMDMGVSHSLSRHFFWSQNVLWKKDLAGRDVTISLAGKDLIVDTEAVGTYMGNKDLSLTPKGGSRSSTPDQKPLLRDSNFVDEDGDETGEADWKNRSWKGKGIDVLWFKDLDHAQVFDKAATRRSLVRAIRAYCHSGKES